MNICGLHDKASCSSKELRIQSTKCKYKWPHLLTAGGFILQVMMCFEQQHLDTETGCDTDQSQQTTWWIESEGEEWRGEEAMYSHTHKLIHTHTHRHRDTHHPHVSALSSRIRACWGKPQACDCVRGGFWVENSIWTEDPIQRCQYSPHYLCSLLIQGRGEADVEQNVNFENAKQTPIRRWQTVAQQTLWKNMIDNFIIVIWPMFQDF